MRWSYEPPQKHIVQAPSRGTSIRDDLYFCLVVYHDNEQEEAGDTLTHTFIKEPWAVCETRYFYFWGTVGGESSPSETPTFALHRTQWPGLLIIDEPWTTEFAPPTMGEIINEEWLTLFSPPTLTPIIYEPWGSTPPADPITRYFTILASFDQAVVHWNGEAYEFQFPPASLPVGYSSPTINRLSNGLRFENIDIPQGSVINYAYLFFVSLFTNIFYGVKSEVFGQKSFHAAPFVDLADFQARPPTINLRLWDYIAPWEAGKEYSTPNLQTIIQEIISQPGWISTNALVLFWGDFFDRSLHQPGTVRQGTSWEFDELLAPLLQINYTPP